MEAFETFGKFSQLEQSHYRLIRAAQLSRSPLLITGATGVGKSLLAEEIHLQNSLPNSRFVKINLATIHSNVIESELFGHERGAFTGADSRRIGKIETAQHGTVFFDEIGELPLHLQSKLLDFIQFKRITPVGANREIELSTRVIAATNRNLEAMVEEGTFREDLYFRLNVFHVRLGQLSQSPTRVAVLAQRILCEMRAALCVDSLEFSVETKQFIESYSWPGNVRELRNVIDFAVSMCASTHAKQIELHHLPEYINMRSQPHLAVVDADRGNTATVVRLAKPVRHRQPVGEDDLNSSPSERTLVADVHTLNGRQEAITIPVSMDYLESKEAFERIFFAWAIRQCRGQINETCRRTGVNKVTLSDKLKRYNIDWRHIRSGFSSTPVPMPSTNQKTRRILEVVGT